MGQVEFNQHKNEQWKMLRSHNWRKEDADVVCKETGHKEALEVINMKDYSRRKNLNKTIFPNNANQETEDRNRKCNGNEYSILRCPMVDSVEQTGKLIGVGVRCKSEGKNVLTTFHIISYKYSVYVSKI